MSLNPVVAIIEQVQKLINEHGSAAILRDHLGLIKDQVLVLQNEKLSLENLLVAADKRNEKLSIKNKKLKKENAIFREEIERYKQVKQGGFSNSTDMQSFV